MEDVPECHSRSRSCETESRSGLHQSALVTQQVHLREQTHIYSFTALDMNCKCYCLFVFKGIWNTLSTPIRFASKMRLPLSGILPVTLSANRWHGTLSEQTGTISLKCEYAKIPQEGEKTERENFHFIYYSADTVLDLSRSPD